MTTIMIVMAVLGAVLYAVINVLNRKIDAYILSQEDYEEDVDGTMTKEEKKAFKQKQQEEKEIFKLPFAKLGSRYYKEKTLRCILIIIFGAGISAAAAWKYGVSAGLVFTFLTFAIMTLQGLIDFDTTELPFELNVLIYFLAVLSFMFWKEYSIKERIIGALCITVPMILLDLAIPNAFGWGDIKLLFGTGALFGWKIQVAGFFMGCIIQALISLIFVITKKKNWKSHLPFGPMLCLGIMTAVLVGELIINWYIDSIMLAMES